MSPRRNVPVIDALPEQYPYRDEGCDASPSCLGCSLPWCKYDDPVAYHRELREGRDMEVVQAKRAGGKSVSELARRFGVSQRTIHRILERAGHDPGTDLENGMVRQAQRKWNVSLGPAHVLRQAQDERVTLGLERPPHSR